MPESRSSVEDESVAQESIKPSRLRRIKNATVTAGIYGIPTGLVVGFLVVGYKMSKMDLEAAKLNLETARLQDIAEAATQQ